MSVRLLLEGPDLQEILGQAREAYGPTVRVVQAEQVRSGGLGGFFAKQHYEVTVEVQNPNAKAPSATSPNAKSPNAATAARKGNASGAAAVSSQNDQALASAQARIAAARAAAFAAADLAAVDDVLLNLDYEDGPAPAPARTVARPAARPTPPQTPAAKPAARAAARPTASEPDPYVDDAPAPTSRWGRKSAKNAPAPAPARHDYAAHEDEPISVEQQRRLAALLNQPAFEDEPEPIAARPGQAVAWQPTRVERSDLGTHHAAPVRTPSIAGLTELPADDMRMYDDVEPAPRMQQPMRRGNAATQVPRKSGQVLVLIGEALQSFAAAHQIATSARIPTNRTIVVTQTEAPLPGVPADRQVSTMAEARQIATQLGRDKGPVVIVIDAPISIAGDPNGRAWIRDVVNASRPDQVWAVVDATRQTATLARWVRAIGDVSALVVHDAASAADPAAIHHIGLPLAFQDGLAVDHQEVMW